MRPGAYMKQSEAVVTVVLNFFPNTEVIPPTNTWTESQKENVYSTLMAMFKAGQWQKSKGGTDDAEVMKYIPGLVNNHVRKDKRLNGGVEYVAKNPGSRSGSGDESIKAMRTLLSMSTDPEAKKQIQAAIDERQLLLKPKTEIKVEFIPAALRHLVPQS